MKASEQDIFDHFFGAGALSYSWWRTAEYTGVDSDGNVSEGWSVKITCDGAEDGKPVTAELNSAALMRAVGRIMNRQVGDFPATDACRRNCFAITFDPDDADFDAATADEVLQVAVLGSIPFG